jgi:hypothetical protein
VTRRFPGGPAGSGVAAAASSSNVTRSPGDS